MVMCKRKMGFFLALLNIVTNVDSRHCDFTDSLIVITLEIECISLYYNIVPIPKYNVVK